MDISYKDAFKASKNIISKRQLPSVNENREVKIEEVSIRMSRCEEGGEE